jgi:hypothetical protein
MDGLQVIHTNNNPAPSVNDGPEVIVLKFADSKIPVFKETRSKDYIEYGEKNDYPEYLTYLFNKSAKHNAILTGKANYIFGKGFENGDFTVNRLGESLNDISKKAILDIEIYGGFRLEIIWNRGKKISEIYHVDYSSIRVGKNGGFYYREKWEQYNKGEEKEIPAFDPSTPTGNQIYAYNEYRPMTRYYPLPSYIGCNNYVETDIEISKYYLSAIRNGMAPSKMIQFFQGEPSEDKKREIEKRFKNKFAGTENAGQFILVFGTDKQKAVSIDDLSGSDLDKQFAELNKTCQQEIFSGHLVTSPMLFGIKTEGQLGGATELKIAYEIFQSTYAKPKATAYSKEIEYLFSFSDNPQKFELQNTDPVGLQLDVKDFTTSLPKSFVFKQLGIPEDEWNNPTVNGDAQTTPAEQNVLANDNIKNLSPKQHQQLLRIIRDYSKERITELTAKTLLKTGLGLTEEDINNILGIEAVALSAQSEDDIIAMFDACGDSKNDYEIIKSKRVVFNEHEAQGDEEIYIQEAFKTYDVTTTENKIIELIKKDSKITPDVIATAINETEAFVKSKIQSLVKRGYLEETISTIGVDEIIERALSKDVTAPPIKTGSVNPTKISIKYSYEVKPGVGPEIIPTSRPFCIKMIQLNRLYSRAEIEKISERLGYSVFDRKGGFWGNKPECRHLWKSNIVIKK